MVVDLNKLENRSREWLTGRAHSHGTTLETEAVALLTDAIRDRMRREQAFHKADQARIRIPGPLLTAEEIEAAINWGRE